MERSRSDCCRSRRNVTAWLTGAGPRCTVLAIALPTVALGLFGATTTVDAPLKTTCAVTLARSLSSNVTARLTVQARDAPSWPSRFQLLLWVCSAQQRPLTRL